MNSLWAIFSAELRMQFKSTRFKAMIPLILFVDFVIYSAAARNLDFDPFNIYFRDMGFIIIFALPAALGALHAMGRVRTTGIQQILMTKPVGTFTLILGQALGAVVSMIPPLLLFFLPPGLLVRWLHDLEFQPAHIFYALLFYLLPGYCCLIALSLWIRTCFKSTLISLIAIAAVVAGAAAFANLSPLMRSGPGAGGGGHNFVPMISLFSVQYWSSLEVVFQQPQISFLHPVDWAHFGLSVLYSGIFLILACYHLRRTEPQRKVLGRYGGRWFHTPTAVKILADLRIDPHVTWRMHLALLAMVGIIAGKTVWPLAGPAMVRRARMGFSAEARAIGETYNPDRIEEDRLLPIRIVSERQALGPREFVDELTITIDGPVEGRLAIPVSQRPEFRIQSIQAEGVEVPFIQVHQYTYIKGEDLAALADGAEHTITIVARRSSAAGQFSYGGDLMLVRLAGYGFADEKFPVPGAPWGKVQTGFRASDRSRRPIRLTLTEDAKSRFIKAPVPPEISHAEGGSKVYTFDFAEAVGDPLDAIYISRHGATAVLELPGADLNLKFVVSPRHALAVAEVLELAGPVIEELYENHHIDPRQPIVVISDAGGRGWSWSAFEARRSSSRYAASGGRQSWLGERILAGLDNFETMILPAIVRESVGRGKMIDRGLERSLLEFLANNWNRGLNHSISNRRAFVPAEFRPNGSAHLAITTAREWEDKPRAELFGPDAALLTPPVISMLYLLLGHEPWWEVIDEVKARMATEDLTAQMLEEIAAEKTGEDLTWFFDYWCRTGRGFPSYRINRAEGRMVTVGLEETTMYDVEIEVENLGTGRMLVPVLLDTSGIPVNEKIWIEAGGTATWKVRSRYMPSQVHVDPEGWIMMKPWWDESIRGWVTRPRASVTMEGAG